jgi:hypothetical protein
VGLSLVLSPGTRFTSVNTMARRAQTKIGVWPMVILLVVLAAFIAGGLHFFSGTSNPYRTIPALEVSAYLENANSLRGNVYRLEATIHNSLAWSPSKGRLISVETMKTKETLAIFIPASLNHINLQKGQHFLFKIEIAKDGLIQAQEMTKS